jgi:hypothetical protein
MPMITPIGVAPMAQRQMLATRACGIRFPALKSRLRGRLCAWSWEFHAAQPSIVEKSNCGSDVDTQAFIRADMPGYRTADLLHFSHGR